MVCRVIASARVDNNDPECDQRRHIQTAEHGTRIAPVQRASLGLSPSGVKFLIPSNIGVGERVIKYQPTSARRRGEPS